MRDISTNCLVFQSLTQSLLSSKEACFNLAFYKDFPVQSLFILTETSTEIKKSRSQARKSH